MSKITRLQLIRSRAHAVHAAIARRAALAALSAHAYTQAGNLIRESRHAAQRANEARAVMVSTYNLPA